jgi:serine/threonine protein phosphatase 1
LKKGAAASKKHPQNNTQVVEQHNYLAIGDIHGCLNSLNQLLKKLEDYSDYTFIFVGDYIDRGPDSSGVIERLIQFQQQQDCIFLRGNHEQMLLDAYFDNKLDLWLTNGGDATLKSYEATYNTIHFPREHLDFYRETRMYFETDDYFFVHAGLSPKKTIEESLADEKHIQDFLWSRSHLNAFETPWEKTVVFGHTARPHPVRKPKMLGIDTGCVYNSIGYGKLTAVILPDEEYIQQVCLDN